MEASVIENISVASDLSEHSVVDENLTRVLETKAITIANTLHTTLVTTRKVATEPSSTSKNSILAWAYRTLQDGGDPHIATIDFRTHAGWAIFFDYLDSCEQYFTCLPFCSLFKMYVVSFVF